MTLSGLETAGPPTPNIVDSRIQKHLRDGSENKTAVVNTAESPDQMKEKFKNFLRISFMFTKILKLTEGKYFRLER